ncbi:MAG: hypothetical protein HMLKMBBP_00640 [Planctomycetes bacterium]|nr:hypothetical protein [Planctomycetota bacterium]
MAAPRVLRTEPAARPAADEADALAERLSAFPLYQKLPRGEVRRLAAGARTRGLPRGTVLFREGDEVRASFAVLSGSVRVVRIFADGREHMLHQLSAGHTLAEAAVLTLRRYPATAIVTHDAVIAEIPASALLRLVAESPDAPRAMIASLSSWLLRMLERVEELSVLGADARLARYLLRLPSQPDGEGFAVRLPLRKKDVATHLCITPETLSRTFRRWADEGIVEITGADVRIASPSALVAIADGSDDGTEDGGPQV